MNKIFLFPLVNSTLFKKVTLPYHIFEPRFIAMIKESIQTQTPVGVVPYQSDGNYQNKICVAGIPHILQRYPDNRLDVYITGEKKCLLQEEILKDQFSIYNYKEIKENLEIDESCDLELDSMKSKLVVWAKTYLPDQGQMNSFIASLDDDELLINYCAVFLIDDGDVKKELMEAPSLKEKLRILLSILGPKEVHLGPFLKPLKLKDPLF